MARAGKAVCQSPGSQPPYLTGFDGFQRE
jgi:hypothetical protein